MENGLYLTTGQIAKDLGISISTATRLIDSGMIPGGFRLPIAGSKVAHRRIHRGLYEQFIQDQREKLMHRATRDVVVAVACDITIPDGLQVYNAASACEGAFQIAAYVPEFVVVSWAIGRLEASQIAIGCKQFNYQTILIAMRPKNYMGDLGEFARYGYSRNIEDGWGSTIKSMRSQGINGTGGQHVGG